MEKNLLNNELKHQQDEKNNSICKKFFVILGMSLILLIPIGLIYGVIGDRVSYKNEAVQKIAQSWANKQTITTPTMSFSIKNEKKEYITKELELNTYNAEVIIKTEIRKKGIFKIPVYTADIIQKGDFINKCYDLNGKKITTNINITDSRGFIKEPTFKINNSKPISVQDNNYTFNLNTNLKQIPFEITYKIRGLDEISMLLGGRTNNVTISGNWKNPEFKGTFLPTERKVTNKDFKATWSIPKIALASNCTAQTQPNFETSCNCNNIGDITVSLLVPINSYSMAERSLNYAFLLLSLTFIGYFIFEITSKEKRQIHPFQYCLLGAAILIFYSLLVSISELLTFNFAYLISAIMVMGLIFAYTYYVITRKEGLKFSVGITLSIGSLYAFFYILLMLQDIALFVGSIGLFIIIATIMYLTRNVSWYTQNNS